MAASGNPYGTLAMASEVHSPAIPPGWGMNKFFALNHRGKPAELAEFPIPPSGDSISNIFRQFTDSRFIKPLATDFVGQDNKPLNARWNLAQLDITSLWRCRVSR